MKLTSNFLPFLAEFEITNIKSQRTSNFQNPNFQAKSLKSYGFIGHWNLLLIFVCNL